MLTDPNTARPFAVFFAWDSAGICSGCFLGVIEMLMLLFFVAILLWVFRSVPICKVWDGLGFGCEVNDPFGFGWLDPMADDTSANCQ